MDYCSNEVMFKGDNIKKVMDHFRVFGDKAPPFFGHRCPQG
ncbi:Uncharacterised protein [Sphingobacterium daejeonense]|nr:Uncharacterised protein [Sphingobacterium daejeonense]